MNCALCDVELGKRYWGDVPGVGDVCNGCHEKAKAAATKPRLSDTHTQTSANSEHVEPTTVQVREEVLGMAGWVNAKVLHTYNDGSILAQSVTGGPEIYRREEWRDLSE